MNNKQLIISNRILQIVANFIGIFALVFLAYSVWQSYENNYSYKYNIRQSLINESTNTKITKLNETANEVFALQLTTGTIMVDQADTETKLFDLSYQASQGNTQLAIFAIDSLAPRVDDAHTKLQVIAASQKAKAKSNPAAVVPTTMTNVANVPILLYHKPPADLNAQLDNLVAKGYTAISMSELADYFDGKSTLPKKPIIITFDDGFTEQFATITQLKAHHMKATYYLIIGSEKSNWCIGVLRQNKTCGDSYMDWSQVHNLVNSGVAEIGAHTLDHPNLAGLSQADQKNQIINSKQALENELGVPIKTFAYPYGRYNAISIGIVQQAGFRTAVTTVAGVQQSLQNRYTLLRERNAFMLP